MEKIKKLLITGGSGFLGKALLRELFQPGAILKPARVVVLDLEPVPGEFTGNVEFIQGDLRDYETLNRACADVDAVIHAAAIVDWGVRSEEEVLGVNVTGTENVVRVCRENKIRYLVHTSSLDAVYSGKPLLDIDESQPYPDKHATAYCRSKFLSEKIVLEANDSDLHTCVLRPSDIYGESDPYHIGSLIDMAKGGFYIRLGNGSSRCQHVYVGNMASALLQAVIALTQNNNKVTGQVYFITDGPGSNFFLFFDQIVRGAGYRIWPANLWLPQGLAYFMGSLSELMALLMRPVRRYAPKLSRFAVTYTCTDFTFTSDKAKHDFGYTIRYTKEEALERTIAFYKHERLQKQG